MTLTIFLFALNAFTGSFKANTHVHEGHIFNDDITIEITSTILQVNDIVYEIRRVKEHRDYVHYSFQNGMYLDFFFKRGTIHIYDDMGNILCSIVNIRSNQPNK